MPNKLKKWIRNHLKSGNPNKDSQEPSKSVPPVLPKERQHVLTPSPSLSILNPTATAESPLFQKLPVELRLKIYKHAFGDHTIHIDLRFDYTKNPGTAHTRSKSKKLRGDWHWWGAVCHRNPEYEIHSDWCRRFPRDMLDNYCLGAMGWLTTCRQAYRESIDVLYSKNTIHISSAILMRHLASLILPQRIANITSLELVFGFPLFYTLSEAQEQEMGMPAYNAIVSVLISSLPRLKKLYLSLATVHDPAPLASLIERYEKEVLGPIDELIIKLGPQLGDCQIALERSIHTAMMIKAQTTGALLEIGERWPLLPYERFWRPVAGDGSANDLGYWVRQGVDNSPIVCTMCTGF